jgi:lipid II:glycine glycyltransferase (peptidoglycan interpeptide bridge formation enzyme)
VSSELGDSDSFKMSEDLENIYIGLIHLAGKIIENFEISFCEKVVIENDLIDEIFVKFLFASIFKENTSESKSDLVKIKPRIITKDENSSSGKFGIKSKEAAYHLLHSLIKKSSLLMNSFLTKSMQPLMNLIRRIDGWGYSPPGSSEKL